MPATNHLVFLDTETTGLDPDMHEVWEIAYAVEDGPIHVAHVEHDPRTADLKVLRMNGYGTRGSVGLAGPEWEFTLRERLTGATIVGSNPAFDAAFLRRRWGTAPWHHRMIDVSAYAMGILGHARPAGLDKLAKELRVAVPAHTAYQDVATLRECYRRLAARAKSNAAWWGAVQSNGA